MNIGTRMMAFVAITATTLAIGTAMLLTWAALNVGQR